MKISISLLTVLHQSLQNGKIEYYERIGEDVHPGTVIGRDGKEIVGDAGDALKKIRSGDAALTTLGGIGEALGWIQRIWLCNGYRTT